MVDFQQLFIALTLFQWASEALINQRQMGRLQHSKVPARLKTYFDILGSSEAFIPSQNYLRDKLRFGQLASIVDLVESALLYTGLLSLWFGNRYQPTSGLKAVWNYAGFFGLVQRRGEIVHSLAFVVCLSLLSNITSIPASLYRTFVIEEKHGFNKTDLKTWVLDLVKSQVLAGVIGLPLIAALLKIIGYAGPSFVSYTLLFVLVLQLVMVPVYPALIAPLFNTFKPITDFKDKPNYVEVADRVEKLAKTLKFPLGKLKVVDGSKRSSHSNAYFFGLPFLSKTIVLYDTLLDQNSPAEVESVLAHELGHWHHNHTLTMMLLGQSVMWMNLSLIRLTLFNPRLYRSFGFTAEKPLLIGLLLSSSLLGPLDTILSFAINFVSRRFEFQADKFAYDLSDEDHPYAVSLKSALVKVGADNKSVTDVDPLYSAYKHSHPTMPERIARLDSLLAAKDRKQ